jgi:hypothetical protein
VRARLCARGANSASSMGLGKHAFTNHSRSKELGKRAVIQSNVSLKTVDIMNKLY